MGLKIEAINSLISEYEQKAKLWGAALEFGVRRIYELMGEHSIIIYTQFFVGSFKILQVLYNICCLRKCRQVFLEVFHSYLSVFTASETLNRNDVSLS